MAREDGVKEGEGGTLISQSLINVIHEGRAWGLEHIVDMTAAYWLRKREIA